MDKSTWVLFGFILFLCILLFIAWILAKWHKERVSEDYVRGFK